MYKIALDGPSGSGKSVMAKAVAKKLGIVYVDTGALYRAIGLYMYRQGVDKNDSETIKTKLSEIDVKLAMGEEGQQVMLNGENVNGYIREPEISMYASKVSAIPEVRSFLLGLQRDTAKHNNVIMDGRDIGTVIFPDAEVKIFLFARDEVRAERRYKELCEKGVSTTFEEVLADMQKRDSDDRNREIAPAVAADDAVKLDSSELTLEETVSAILHIIEEKLSNK